MKHLIYLFSFIPFFSALMAQESIEESLARAQVLYNASEYEEARQLYEEALSQTREKWQRDLLVYNLGTTLLAEGKQKNALQLWSETDWLDSPSPWLSRRLHWNTAVAQIQKAQSIDSSSLEGKMAKLRLLNIALTLFKRSQQAECIWQNASQRKQTSPDIFENPCEVSLRLQEAVKWVNQELANVQTAFRTQWIMQVSAPDLVGALLASAARLADVSDNRSQACEGMLQQISTYWNSLQRFPSLASSLHPAFLRFKTACFSPSQELRQQAYFALEESAKRLKYSLYPAKKSAEIRLLYAKGLAEGGNLLDAREAAKQHLSLLTGSQEGKWAVASAELGLGAFQEADLFSARLLWQSACFWMDEEALFLDHPPSLEEVGETLLRRHLFTEFFITHLLFSEDEDFKTPPALKEQIEHLLRSMLTSVASFFSLAKEAQKETFEANSCSLVAWQKSLPAINQGEKFIQSALQLLQNVALLGKGEQIAIASALERAYPFWVTGIKGLSQTHPPQPQETQSPSASQATLSSGKPLSLEQRRMLLQEMEAEDNLHKAPPASILKEARPW